MSLLAGSCTISQQAPPTSGLMTLAVGSNPVPSVIGSPGAALDLVVEVTTGGALGTAWVRSSNNGGSTWGDPVQTLPPTITDHGVTVVLGSYGREVAVEGGVKVRFQAGATVYVAGDQWTYALPVIAGTPTVGGSRLAKAFGDIEAPVAFVAILAAGACPIPDADPERSAAVTTQIAGFVARATAKYAEAVTRVEGYATAILGELTTNGVPIVGGVSGTLT